MKEEKLKRFVADQAMSEAVYEVLLNAFLKDRKTEDVAVLAAERIALLRLQDAWRELKKYMPDSERDTSPKEYL